MTTLHLLLVRLDFLGQNIRKYNGKLLIMPSKRNVKTFLAKVRGIVKTSKAAKTGNLILQLNPMIQGWANYHRHIVSKKVFTSVHAAIFKTLWRWACRRHPKKNSRWVKKKYFTRVGGNNWVFFGEAWRESRRLDNGTASRDRKGQFTYGLPFPSSSH